MRTALKWIAGVLATLVVALALFVAFGLDSLRGPITRAVTNATGRELVIDGRIRAVWSWLHPRFRVERVRFANADFPRPRREFRFSFHHRLPKELPLVSLLLLTPSASVLRRLPHANAVVNANVALPTQNLAVADQSVLSAIFRVQRNFWP